MDVSSKCETVYSILSVGAMQTHDSLICEFNQPSLGNARLVVNSHFQHHKRVAGFRATGVDMYNGISIIFIPKIYAVLSAWMLNLF